MKMRYLKGWTSYNESVDNDNDSEANKFQYMMLGRLQTDCDYFLGNGQRSVNNLWGATIEEHIAEMKKIWTSLENKPEWLTMEQIEDYERQMLGDTDTNGGQAIEQNKCVCIKTIKFKNGMNYFKDLTYTCEMNIDKVSVGYEDGRFTTMGNDVFDIHFQVI